MAHHAPRVFNEINITPLTDIFLVLLIIMMVVAPMLDYPGLKLAVPSVGPDQNTTQEPKALTVRVLANGTTELIENELPQSISLPLMANRLRELKSKYPDGLIIQVDPNATHEGLTRVMDAGQQAGVEKIAVTKLDGPEATPTSSAANDLAQDLAAQQP